MVTKLKNKMKKYISTIWSVEIMIFIIISIVLVISYTKEFNTYESTVGVNSFNAIFNKEKVRDGLLYLDSYTISKDIYTQTEDLNKVSKDRLDGTIFNRYNVMYVLFDKKSFTTYTNSATIQELSEENNNVLSESKIFIRLKNLGYDLLRINNDGKKFNCYVDKEKYKNGKSIDTLSLSDFTEFYFVPSGTYETEINQMVLNGIFLIILTIIDILLLLKIIILLCLKPDEFKEKINVIKKIIYVLRNGFIYKHSNRKLKIALVGTVCIIIAYLYLVAGVGNQNIIIAFLAQYPFKGTLVILMIPLLCLIYSLKKTIDIDVINNLLTKVKDGDLELEIEYSGENEIKELVDNINEIKEGYKIALSEKLKNEKLKSDLITNISHDVKTPLTSIINYINILKNEDLTEEDRKKYFDIIENKSAKLKILIDDLFDISKLNSGKIRIEKQEIDVVSLIYQVIGEASNLYTEKNIKFKVTSSSESIYMSLDGMMISRVFENAIINALKYSIENTRVFIDIEDKDKYIEIVFKNIANYQMDFDKEEIFERFVRADKSRTSSIEGSGIGLTIAKSIVELHNGEINIDLDGDMFKLIIKLPKKTFDK